MFFSRIPSYHKKTKLKHCYFSRNLGSGIQFPIATNSRKEVIKWYASTFPQQQEKNSSSD